MASPSSGKCISRRVVTPRNLDVTNTQRVWRMDERGNEFRCVKCVFDGVVISPELFHRRLIGNVDERPLRFPAYRIPPLESRFVHVRVSSILFSLSFSPLFIRLLLIFFLPLFVEILFCFFRAWTQRNRYTRNGVWWFLILRGTVLRW